MQLIYSLLLKDFYINTDLISSFNDFPDEIYQFQDNILLLQDISNQKLLLKNILFIIDDSFYSQLEDTIKSKEKKFNINLEASNMFELLYQPSDYTQTIISKITNFYKEFNFKTHEINSTNFMVELEKEINISKCNSLSEHIKSKLELILKEQNYRIFDEIIRQHNNTVSNIDCKRNKDIDNIFEYFQFRLFMFFKIIGKDFISFINKPISCNDSITTVIFKFNKNFLLRIRYELINYWYYKENNIFFTLTSHEIFLIIFLLTYRDKHFTLLDNFCVEYHQNEKKYSDKSIRLHQLYHFIK